MATLIGSGSCPDISGEGLICTLGADHPGNMHKDQSDPSTEIQWQKPRPSQEITLGQLVTVVDSRVRARAAALLAQAPALGYEPARSGPSQIFPGRRPSPGARRTGTP